LAVKHQDLQIGTPLRVAVYWYDRVCEPPQNVAHESEVVGWRTSQLIVRVPNYGVIRIWKRNGMEVGNPDYQRRGFRVDLSELAESVKPDGQTQDGPGIQIAIDTDA